MQFSSPVSTPAWFAAVLFDVSRLSCPSVLPPPSPAINLSQIGDQHQPLHLEHHQHHYYDPRPSPWTQEPLCTAKNASDPGEPLCIFTSATFANGRGISLVTTPSVAAAVARTPAFVDPRVLDDIAADTRYPYVVTQLPGRGTGLIANTTLHPGDRVFAHTPATIFSLETFERMPDEGELGRLRFQTEAVNRLPEGLRAKWWALLGHFGGDQADDIMNTNSFAEKFGEEKAETGHLMVLPETSRLNHDCRPNCQYYFDHKSLTHFVHATRTIFPGEELTISYTDPLTPRHERHSHIKSSWGFECSCSLCTQAPDLTSASDFRIEQILELEDLLDEWSSPANRSATPQMAEFVVELYEQERLYGPIADAYYRAAVAWSTIGDEWQTRKWAAKAATAARLHNGPTSDAFLLMDELAYTPKEHWSWNWMDKKA